MRRTLPGINYLLAAAVQRVAKLYIAIPEAERPDVTGERWQALEAEVDRACGAGDGAGAVSAINRWEAHARRVLVSREGPSEVLRAGRLLEER